MSTTWEAPCACSGRRPPAGTSMWMTATWSEMPGATSDSAVGPPGIGARRTGVVPALVTCMRWLLVVEGRRADAIAAAVAIGAVGRGLRGAGGGEMGETDVGFGERLKPGGFDRRADLRQRSLHEPEMEGADDLAVFLGEFEEGAVPQADTVGRLTRVAVGLRVEAEVGEEFGESVDRFPLGHGMEGRRRWHQVLPPGAAGVDSGLRVRGRELAEQDSGQELIAALAATVHPAVGCVDGTGASRPGRRLLRPFHGTLRHQRLQVEADRIGMDAHRLGDLVDAHGCLGLTQGIQHGAAAWGLPVLFVIVVHGRHLCPSWGGRAAMSG